MADIDYTQMAEAIVSALNTSTEARSAAAELDKERSARTKNIEAMLNLSRSVKETGSATATLRKFLLNQRADYQNISDKLKTLDEQIEKTTEHIEKDRLIEERAAAKRAVITANFNALLNNASLGLIKFSTQLGTTIVSAGGQFVRGLQRGSSEVELSTGLMTAGVDLAKQTISGAGSAIQGFGSALMIMPGRTKIAGAALVGLGSVLNFTTDKFSSLAKFGIEVLGAEIEKTIGAFARTSNAGLIFANGMTEMRNSAHYAGLTVDTYSKVVARSADGLVGLGGTVTAGNKRFVETSKAMLPFRDGLLNLGISIEEQAQSIIDYGSMIRTTGQSQTMTAAELAKGTTDYLINLRTLSNLTGEDAKKMQERADAARRQAAVQAKLAEMGPEGIEKFNAALALAGPQFQQALMQKFLGGPATGAAAVVLAQSQSMESYLDALIGGIKNGALNMDAYVKELGVTRSRFAPLIASETKSASEIIGIAGIYGKLGEESSILSDTFRQMKDASKVSVDALMANARTQFETKDPFTQNVNNVINQLNLLKTNLEAGLNSALPGYSQAVSEMTKQIYNAVERVKNLGKETVPEKTITDTLVKALNRGKDLAYSGMAGGAVVGGIGGMIAGPAGSAALAAKGALVGGVGGLVYGMGESLAEDAIGAITNWFNRKEGKATGGVARGPSTGYIEKLHGIEAVVPLSGGRSIPVTLEMVNSAVKADNSTPIDIDNVTSMFNRFIDSTSILALAVRDTKSLSDDFIANLSMLSRFIDDSNKSFLNNLVDSKQFLVGIVDRFANIISDKIKTETQDVTRPTVPIAIEIMQLKPNAATLNISEYLAPQLDSLVMSKNILVEFTQDLDSKLTAFKTDIKRSMEIAKPVAGENTPAQQPSKLEELEFVSLFNDIKLTNRELKDTLMMQNQLLEKNIKTTEDLVSVANDTRNYSQLIAQNTL